MANRRLNNSLSRLVEGGSYLHSALKECGVNVDQKTLLGALRYWYRFTGHGTVPYGDHRPEGGLELRVLLPPAD